MTEMLVAKLPDPPSEDPNEDDVKDEEILRKLSKLKKFNKKWLDNENSAPVEEKVRVADNVLKEVEETGVPKVDTKRAEVMKAKVETADDTISEEKEHPSVEESVEINEVNTDVEKEEDKFESVEVKNKIASKPLDRSALDTNDEALDADENDHDVNESDKLEERKFCVFWQTTRLSYWRQCPSALDNFMSVLCSVNMDLVVAVEVDETASADKHYGVRPCVMPRLFPR